MNHTAHYSDEDLQAFTDGTFTGDTAALSEHLHACPHCRTSVNAYQAIAAFAADAWKEPSLSTNLAAAVNSAVNAGKKQPPVWERVLHGTMLALLIALTAIGGSKLVTIVPIPMMLLLIIPVALYSILSVKERTLLHPAQQYPSAHPITDAT